MVETVADTLVKNRDREVVANTTGKKLICSETEAPVKTGNTVFSEV